MNPSISDTGLGSWLHLEVVGPGERSQASLVLAQCFESVLNGDDQLGQLPLQDINRGFAIMSVKLCSVRDCGGENLGVRSPAGGRPE